MVPRDRDLAVMLNLLARSATGQTLSVYTEFIAGPRAPVHADGPDEMHVIFLDNGRTDILAGDAREILRCIRCGACLNVCPVYRQASGHAYRGVYPGPVGAVLTPLLAGGHFAEFADLPRASSLCGACNEVCPVDIPIPDLLLRPARATPARTPGGPGALASPPGRGLWSTRAGFAASTSSAGWPPTGPRPGRGCRAGPASWAEGRELPGDDQGRPSFAGSGPQRARVRRPTGRWRRSNSAAGCAPVWPDAAAPMTDRWVRCLRGPRWPRPPHDGPSGSAPPSPRSLAGRVRSWSTSGSAPTRHRGCRTSDRPRCWCCWLRAGRGRHRGQWGGRSRPRRSPATGSVVVDSDRNGRLVSLLPRVGVFVLSWPTSCPPLATCCATRDEHWPDGPPTNVVLVTGPVAGDIEDASRGRGARAGARCTPSSSTDEQPLRRSCSTRTSPAARSRRDLRAAPPTRARSPPAAERDHARRRRDR